MGQDARPSGEIACSQSENGALAAAIRKATRRLIPFLCFAYIVNFLDRVNIGFAALHMNKDLGFTPAVFGFGAGIFFLGYIAFEIPSNLALHRFGARLWIARIMISWGLVACAMALVHTETGFYVMRFLLGVAEAGFFPGIILYLTFWFPAERRARIVALFMAAVPLATVVGAPLSGALLKMRGVLGLAGWHWLFIIEGIPAILLGIAAFFVLTDKPGHASWLTKDEASALEAALHEDAETAKTVGYADLWQALTQPRVLALGLLYFLMVIGLYGIGFWMPQVIQTFWLDPVSVGFLTAIPYLFAAIAMVAWGRHSDRTGERRWHIALPLSWRRRPSPGRAVGDRCFHHDRADARHARLLRRIRPVLVAAHGAAHRNGRGSRHRASQFHGQRRGLCRTLYRRGVERGDGELLGGAPVPGGGARARRPHGAGVPGA